MGMERLTRDLKGYSGGAMVSHEIRMGYKWKGSVETRPPMPMDGRYSSTTPGPGRYRLGSDSTSTFVACFSNEALRAKNLAMQRAWSKFRDSCYDTASIGTAVAEGRESLNLIGSRATQLGKAFLSLKRGQFRRFLKLLQVRPLKKDQRTRWTRPKDAASIWLEYWMGWAPMIGDIYDAMKVLSGEIPSIPVVAYASAPFQHTIKMSGYGIDHTASNSGKAGAKYSGVVVVTNLNLASAEQLGLINPAVVAWELVPFSFIVNWFIPVQDYLANYSFGAGMEISKREMTVRTKVTGSELRINNNQVEWSNTSRAASFSRVVDSFILPPRLLFDPPNKLSKERAATAISLLVSIFTKG